MGKVYQNAGSDRRAGKVKAVKQVGEAPKIASHGGVEVFDVGSLVALRRFLVLGIEGGTYYVTEGTQLAESVASLTKAMAADGKRGTRVADLIIEIGQAGAAIKHDTVLLAAAIVLGETKTGTANKRKLANNAGAWLRTGGHVLSFAQMLVKRRNLRSGVAGRLLQGWYEEQNPDQLAYQLLKYQQRNGWSQRDVLRQVHPAPRSDDQRAVLHWAAKGWNDIGPEPHANPMLVRIWARERALLDASNPARVAELIRAYGLSHEMLPTEVKTSPEVWHALIETKGALPLGALIRNLASMTRHGALPLAGGLTAKIVKRLTDPDELKRARVHPFNLLYAMRTYESGRSLKGSATWTPIPAIVAGLEKAFYAALVTQAPIPGTHLLAVDTSNSMMSSIGSTPISVREAAVAMSMAMSASADASYTIGFTDQIVDPLPISARGSLSDNMSAVTRKARGAGTEIGLPIRWALEQAKRGTTFESFVLFTDNEQSISTAMRPMDLLRQYRAQVNPNAKLVVCAMTATRSTVADANDPNTLELVGFDPTAPAALRAFLTDGQAGNLDLGE